MSMPWIRWTALWLAACCSLPAAVVIPTNPDGIPQWLVPGQSSEDIPDDILAPRTLLEHQELAPKAAWEALARIAAIKDKVKQAMILHAGERYRDAYALLEELNLELPGQPDIYLAQSDALYRLTQYDEALAKADEAIVALLELKEDDRRPRMVRLLCLERLRRHSEALLEVDLLLKKEPDHIGLLERKAWNLLQNGQSEEAEKEFFALAQAYPDKPRTHLWTAHAMRANRRTGRAQLAYTFTLELATDPNVRAEALNGLGMIAFDRDHQVEALDFFEQALSLRPNSPRVLRNKARVLRQKDDLTPALSILRQALSADLLAPLTWRMYVDALQEHLELPRPSRTPDSLRGADSDTRLIWRLDRIQRSLGTKDITQALADCLATIEITMRDAQLLNNTGVLVEQLIGREAGAPFFRLALLADPEYLPARHNLEQVQVDSSDPEEQPRSVAELKQHLGDHPRDLASQYALAQAYLRDNLNEPALDTLEHLLKNSPAHMEAHILRARIQSLSPLRRAEAIRTLAGALDPEQSTGWVDLLTLAGHLFVLPEDWRPIHPAKGMGRSDRAHWYARQAGIQFRRKHPKAGRYYTLQAVQTEPESVERLLAMAQATLNLPETHGLANALALRAWAIDPSPASRKESLAISAAALSKKGENLKTGTTYKLGAVPNTVQAYNLAQAGDFPAALALYERVLREDPGHIGARTGRIRVLAYQKEYDKARHLAQVLVHEYPEQSEAHALYGWVIEREPDIPTETLQACVEAFGPLAQSPEHRVLILEIRSRLPDPISSEQKNTLREEIQGLPRSLRQARLGQRLDQLP